MPVKASPSAFLVVCFEVRPCARRWRMLATRARCHPDGATATEGSRSSDAPSLRDPSSASLLGTTSGTAARRRPRGATTHAAYACGANSDSVGTSDFSIVDDCQYNCTYAPPVLSKYSMRTSTF